MGMERADLLIQAYDAARTLANKLRFDIAATVAREIDVPFLCE